MDNQNLTSIKFSDNAKIILKNRYLSENETPEERMWEMCRYVASKEISSPTSLPIKYWTERFYNKLIAPLKFLPNSPTIKNAGVEGKRGLQACNVISPSDTLESIYDTVKEWALTEKYGAGIGAYFGDIRAKGSPVNSVHGTALGPVAVMEILSKSSDKITQAAFREGAHMAVLPINHKDIIEFIHCKDNCKLPNDILYNFNISVQMPDWFMKIIEEKGIYTSSIEYEKYTTIWNEICESAWKTGDPGLFFIDRIRETEPNPQIGLIQSPNPCGEQPLENYNSCNLGSINLGKFVKDSNYNNPTSTLDLLRYHSNNKKEIDWEDLKETIHLAVRFLDDVIDVNKFPDEVPQLTEINQLTRRIGLGVMGWADMLVKLNIPYESEEAIILAKNISRFLTEEAWIGSVMLGEEKGSFPEWNVSKLKERNELDLYICNGIGPRNSCVTTVAPTGTLNILADCSSGIEPYYSLYTKRKTLWKQGESQATIIEIPTLLKELIEQNCEYGDLDNAIQSCIKEDNYDKLTNLITRTSHINGIDKSYLFKTALEISPEWHIQHQSAWQAHITNGISKTINLSNNATIEDISNTYILAWKSKCKGATIYRNGSKDIQVLNTNINEESENTIWETDEKLDECCIRGCKDIANSIHFTIGPLCDYHAAIIEENKFKDLNSSDNTELHPVKRPNIVIGDTTAINTGHGKVYVTVNSIEGKPFEIFAPIGKAGGCDSAMMEAISRLASLALRSGICVEEVVDQLRNITCHPVYDNGFHIMSIPDAMSKVLYDHMKNKDTINFSKSTLNTKVQDKLDNILIRKCNICGGEVQFTEGCLKCWSCGWSKC